MRQKIVVRAKNLELAERAIAILEAEHPMTLRQLYYRLVSAGVLYNDQREYKRLGSLMTRLREAGHVPRTWIVDHVRSTLKPSSWTGLADFTETVRDAYRKDFWASHKQHVEVFVEKDAIAGTIQPVTAEYDVALRVCRGYSSVSFAGEIADLWQVIDKPIFAYYLGDFDPSGFDLERDLREKLERYSRRCFCADSKQLDRILRDNHRPISELVCWQCLAVQEADFEAHELIVLPIKQSDKRAKQFMREYGPDCAEVDALPPSELRARVQTAIERHIDQRRWRRLRETERLERESLGKVLDGWKIQPNGI
jgi:hypothetical protein